MSAAHRRSAPAVGGHTTDRAAVARRKEPQKWEPHPSLVDADASLLAIGTSVLAVSAMQWLSRRVANAAGDRAAES